MAQLKVNSIYALPDGRAFVVRTSGLRGSYFLHDLQRAPSVVPTYLVDAAGQIFSWGVRLRWTSRDLRAVEQVAQPAESVR
jgi:hypothetical protein